MVLSRSVRMRIIGTDHFKIHLHALLDRRVFKLLDNAVPVLRFCNAAEGLIQVVLAVGILDMGEKFGSFSHEMIPSSS